MTRKDFEAMAVALKVARYEGHGLSPASVKYMREQWENCVDAVARVFATGNPRFDLAKFRRACGWEN